MIKDYSRIIMGIDPGTTIMGYGILAIQQRNPLFIAMGSIDLKKVRDPYIKLETIFSKTKMLIEKFHPDELAIESPFFGKNIQSMLKLGRAQGVAIAAAISHQIPVHEYAPRKIKMAITGQGAASKEQVASLLGKILHLKDIPDNLDATDGLAAALCHFYQDKAILKETSYRNWEEFIRKNPDRMH